MNLVHTKSKITKKMKLYILFFSFLITTICACSDKAYIQHFADIKYTGKDIPTLGFQIKGFYVQSAELEDKKSDLKESVFIFYKDGVFAHKGSVPLCLEICKSNDKICQYHIW